MKILLALLILIPNLSWGLTLNEIFNFILYTDIEEIGKMILWIIIFISGGYFALKLIEVISDEVSDYFYKKEQKAKKENQVKNDWEPNREKRLKAMKKEMFIFKLKGIVYAAILIIIIILFIFPGLLGIDSR